MRLMIYISIHLYIVTIDALSRAARKHDTFETTQPGMKRTSRQPTYGGMGGTEQRKKGILLDWM